MLLYLLEILKWNIVCIFCSTPAPCLKAFALTGRDCSNTRYPGCRFACPGLCAPLGFQPALAKSETWVTMNRIPPKLSRFNAYFEHPASQRAIAPARGIRGVPSPALGNIYYKKHFQRSNSYNKRTFCTINVNMLVTECEELYFCSVKIHNDK